MYPKYKSKYGYYIDEDEIDSYGVEWSKTRIKLTTIMSDGS